MALARSDRSRDREPRSSASTGPALLRPAVEDVFRSREGATASSQTQFPHSGGKCRAVLLAVDLAGEVKAPAAAANSRAALIPRRISALYMPLRRVSGRARTEALVSQGRIDNGFPNRTGTVGR